jgi:phosphoglycolate phosphatase
MRAKLLLFDIDGTLLLARGIPKIVLKKVLVNRFPGFRFNEDFDYSGRTDPEIIEDLLHFADIHNQDHLVDDILHDFTAMVQQEFSRNHKPYLLPGVAQLISKLSNLENVYLGLVTGNIAEGARIKLQSVHLLKYFPVGAFGNDSKNRLDLPPIALQRAENYYGRKFDKRDTWIIGDSIFDVACARENNLRCLAVASAYTSYDKLAAAGAEFLENDLSDPTKIIDILLNK